MGLTITSSAGRHVRQNQQISNGLSVIGIISGGTSGCVVAGRLAEDPGVKVLIIEAGPDSAGLDNVHMPGG